MQSSAQRSVDTQHPCCIGTVGPSRYVPGSVSTQQTESGKGAGSAFLDTKPYPLGLYLSYFVVEDEVEVVELSVVEFFL